MWYSFLCLCEAIKCKKKKKKDTKQGRQKCIIRYEAPGNGLLPKSNDPS